MRRLPPRPAVGITPGRPAGDLYSEDQKCLRPIFMAHLKNRLHRDGRIPFYRHQPGFAPFFSRKRHTVRAAIIYNMPYKDLTLYSKPAYKRTPSPLSICSAPADNMTLSTSAVLRALNDADLIATCGTAAPARVTSSVAHDQFYNSSSNDHGRVRELR